MLASRFLFAMSMIETLAQEECTAALLRELRWGRQVKQSFEQIFSPPFIVESVWAELGENEAQDVLVRVHYDGNHLYERGGVMVAHGDTKKESEAGAWLRQQIKPEHTLGQCAGICLVAWQAIADDKPFAEVAVPERPALSITGKTLEAALLDRKSGGAVRYRELDLK